MNNINNTQNNVFLKALLHYGGILFSLFSQCIIVSLTLKCVPVLTTNYVIPLLLIFFLYYVTIISSLSPSKFLYSLYVINSLYSAEHSMNLSIQTLFQTLN